MFVEFGVTEKRRRSHDVVAEPEVAKPTVIAHRRREDARIHRSATFGGESRQGNFVWAVLAEDDLDDHPSRHCRSVR